MWIRNEKQTPPEPKDSKQLAEMILREPVEYCDQYEKEIN
jgi:hypothetical protein